MSDLDGQEREALNTHYAVVCFSGDPDSEHADEELRGCGPSLTLIACGPEDFCWDSVNVWVKVHPLRRWETVEVLARDARLARAQAHVAEGIAR